MFIVENTLVALVKTAYGLSDWITAIDEVPRLFRWLNNGFLSKLKYPEYYRWRSPRVWRGREVSTESEAASLDIDILVTAYSATLEVSALHNSIVALSESTDPAFWYEYTSKLEESATTLSDPRYRWSKPVLA